MERQAQKGITFKKMNYILGHLILINILSIGTLIEMHILHVDLGTWEVLQGVVLVLLLVDLLSLTMIMAMTDTWNSHQTIMTAISVITVRFPPQSVPILLLLVIFMKISIQVMLFFPILS
jgi:hypothetical protein